MPKQQNSQTELINYKKKVKKRLNELTRVLARVSIGDFTQNLTPPDEEDEFTELFVGVQLLLEVIRENLDQLQHLNDALSDNIRTMEQVNETIEREKVIDESILESIGEGLIVTNTKEKIVIVNAQAEQMLGMKMKDIIGRKWHEVIRILDDAGHQVPRAANPVSSVLATRQKVRHTFMHVRTSQVHDLTVAATASPIVLGKALLGVVVVMRNMEEERQIDQAKTEVVSFTSHQLRTPLSVINWYSEVLLGQHYGQLTDKQLEYLQTIQFTTRRMIELVNTFLSVSRIQLGTLVTKEERLDIRALLNDVVSEFATHVAARSLTLTVDSDKDLQPIYSDPKLTRVLFQNLVHNAVKFTPDGGTITVKAVNAECGDGYVVGDIPGNRCVVVAISDTGYGIPKREQRKIFTKLFRAQNAQQVDTEGTGLGLYMVKSIVNYVGGEVWFESVINKGTTFFVALPLRAKSLGVASSLKGQPQSFNNSSNGN